MMITATITAEDLDRLLSIAERLRAAGRLEQALAVARAYVFACSVFQPLSADEADEEFAVEFAQGLRDLDEGRTVSHATVLRRLQATDHA